MKKELLYYLRGLKIISNPKSLREEVVNQGKGNFDVF